MKTHRAAFLAIALAGAVADLATKSWAFSALGVDPALRIAPPHVPIDVIPGCLAWRASANPGIVWGLFQSVPGLFTVLAALAVPLIAGLYWRTAAPGRLYTAALGLILAGALGNLYDRLVFGHVRDFIDFHVIHYPTFNVADSFICAGVALLAWHILTEKPAPATPPTGGSAPPPPAPPGTA
jgi:signal peptidase II